MITEKETGTLTVDHQGNDETRKANSSNGKCAQTNKKRRKQTKTGEKIHPQVRTQAFR